MLNNAKESLLEALVAYQIKVISDTGNRIFVEKEYEIEVEQNGVYKLLSDGMVIAPFRDLKELCIFIKNYG